MRPLIQWLVHWLVRALDASAHAKAEPPALPPPKPGRAAPPVQGFGFIREHPRMSVATQRKLLGGVVAATTYGGARPTRETSLRGVPVVEFHRDWSETGDEDRAPQYAALVNPEPGCRARRAAAQIEPPDKPEDTIP